MITGYLIGQTMRPTHLHYEDNSEHERSQTAVSAVIDHLIQGEQQTSLKQVDENTFNSFVKAFLQHTPQENGNFSVPLSIGMVSESNNQTRLVKSNYFLNGNIKSTEISIVDRKTKQQIQLKKCTFSELKTACFNHYLEQTALLNHRYGFANTANLENICLREIDLARIHFHDLIFSPEDLAKLTRAKEELNSSQANYQLSHRQSRHLSILTGPLKNNNCSQINYGKPRKTTMSLFDKIKFYLYKKILMQCEKSLYQLPEKIDPKDLLPENVRIISRTELLTYLHKINDEIHQQNATLQKTIALLSLHSDRALSYKEWAYISVALNYIDFCFKQGQIRLPNEMRKIFLMKCIHDLDLVSQLSWAHYSQQAIIRLLTPEYMEKWDQGYFKQETYKAKLGASFGSGIEGGGATTLTTGLIEEVDDERKYGEKKYIETGLEGHFSAGIPLIVNNTTTLTAAKQRGKYMTWSSALVYLNHQFSSVVDTHGSRKQVIPFTSRLATLSCFGDPLLRFIFGMTASNEVSQIGNLYKKYTDLKDNLQQNLNLLALTPTTTGIPKQVRDQLASTRAAQPIAQPTSHSLTNPSTSSAVMIADPRQNKDNDRSIDSDIPHWNSRSEALSQHQPPQFIHLPDINPKSFKPSSESDLIVNIVKAENVTEIGINSLFSGHFDVVLDYSDSTYASKRNTPFCVRLNDKTKDPKITTEISDALYQQSANLLINLWEHDTAFWMAENPLPNATKSANDERNRAELTRFAKHKTALSQNNIQFAAQLISRDLDFLTQLHVRKQTGDLKVDLMLHQIYNRYGAKSSDSCLHHMTVLNAMLFSLVVDPELKANLMRQEAKLLSAPFSQDTDYLKRFAYYNETFDLKKTDRIISVSTGAKMDVISLMHSGIKIEAAVTWRERKHWNQLRAGTYWDIKLSFGTNSAINAKLIETVSAGLRELASQENLSLEELPLEDLELALESDCSVAKQFHIRSYKNIKSQFPAKHTIERDLLLKETNAGFNPSIPVVPSVVNIELGFAYSKHTQHCKKSTYAGNFNLIAMHYFQKIVAKNVNNPDDPDNDFRLIKIEQQQAFERLMLSYAIQLRFNHLVEQLNNPSTKLNDIQDQATLLSETLSSSNFSWDLNSQFTRALKRACIHLANSVNQETMQQFVELQQAFEALGVAEEIEQFTEEKNGLIGKLSDVAVSNYDNALVNFQQAVEQYREDQIKIAPLTTALTHITRLMEKLLVNEGSPTETLHTVQTALELLIQNCQRQLKIVSASSTISWLKQENNQLAIAYFKALSPAKLATRESLRECIQQARVIMNAPFELAEQAHEQFYDAYFPVWQYLKDANEIYHHVPLSTKPLVSRRSTGVAPVV